MNELKFKEEEISQEVLFKNILIICPKCNEQRYLKVPSKIIIESENLTTISIPGGMICEHHFQAFVDKFSSVRGYQVVDFEFPKMEYYQSRILEGEEKEDLSNLTSLPLFQDIINLLRGCVDDREILSTALFTVEGKVLYSSIPHSTLFNTIREFEVRNEKKLHSIIKMFLELRNHQKVCSEYIVIHDIEFILIMIFSKSVNFGIGNMFLRDITKKIKEMI